MPELADRIAHIRGNASRRDAQQFAIDFACTSALHGRVSPAETKLATSLQRAVGLGLGSWEAVDPTPLTAEEADEEAGAETKHLATSSVGVGRHPPPLGRIGAADENP